MTRIILRYGISIGLLLSIWMLLEYFLGLHTTYRHIGRFTGYASVLLLAMGLQKALLHYRTQKNSLNWPEAVITGTITGTAAAIVLSLFLIFYYTVLNTGTVASWQQKAPVGAKPVEFIRAQVLAMFISTITGSVLISAVAGYFLRTMPEHDKQT